MANAIRGDGLLRAYADVVELMEDPLRLDHARRFSDYLPSYRSY